MAELAATYVEDLKPKSNRDDYFITGFLRERLPWISLRLHNTFRSCCYLIDYFDRQLDGGLWGYIWDNFLSKCTWLGVTKNVFFNNYVINKSSGNISYVQVKGSDFSQKSGYANRIN